MTLKQPALVQVTVVVPTFRRPSLLRACIAACDAQVADGLGPIEILVVDNCPNRSAEEVVATIAACARYRVHYVHEPRPGISRARNAGLEAAQGEYAAFIDDDEVPDQGWLAALVDAARRFQADAVLAPVVPSRPLRGEAEAPWPATGSLLGSTTISPFWARAGRHYPRLATNNTLLRRTSPAIAGVAFDPRLGLTGGEDTVYFNNILSRGAKLVSCAEAIVREHVEVDRLTLTYALGRSFRGGQIISWAPMLAKPAMPMLTSLSMATGLLQFPAYMALAAWSYALRRPEREVRLRQFMAALGKVFWAQPFRYRAYGATVKPQA